MVSLDFLDIETLKSSTRIAGTIGYRPHRHQGLQLIPSFLCHVARNAARTEVRGRPARTVIVLALDGIHYDLAPELWAPDCLVPLTSTFPSTSVVGWLTAATGLTPQEHGVPGVVFRSEHTGELFDCISDEGITADGARRQDLTTRIGSWQTAFDRLASTGVICTAVVGDLKRYPGRWRDAILRGCVPSPSGSDELASAASPDGIVSNSIRATNKALARLDPASRSCVWSFVNLDEYAHGCGYDAPLRRALVDLQVAIDGWTSEGHTIILYSDHGMTASTPDKTMLEAWDYFNGPSFCILPPGGAGRARWSYPRPGREGDVARGLREHLGQHALVASQQTMQQIGLLEAHAPGVGPVISIATTPAFPSADSRSSFDHGSFTYDEMFVPLAIWSSDPQECLPRYL